MSDTTTSQQGQGEGQGQPGSAPAGQQTGTAEARFTQDDVNRIVGERLSRERQNFADYDDLKAAASKVPDLEQQLTQASARVSELEPENLRLSVAMSKGVPADLADRLRGDTEDELSQDADRLLALIGSSSEPIAPRVPAPDPGQGGNGGTPPGLGSDQLLETIKSKLGVD